MPVTTGPPLYPGSGTFPGSSTYPGQGDLPLAWVMHSTSDVNAPTPVWASVTSLVRSFETSRGRENPTTDFDAGSGTVVVDNRTRVFDPANDPNIKPGNRWWIREQFNGATNDVFVGYATGFPRTWPGQKDDEVQVTLTDELSRLARDSLPTMDPPRDSYSDVVQSDNPSLYWKLEHEPGNREWQAVVGYSLFPLVAGAGYNGLNPGAIRGDGHQSFQALELATGTAIHNPTQQNDDPAYLGDLSNVTLECWFQKSTNPAAERGVMVCPYAFGPNTSFEMTLNTSGQIVARARNSLAVTHTATGTTLANDTWYHLVATYDGANLTLYINGAQAAQTAHTGAFPATLDTNPVFRIGDNAGGLTMRFDEPALYRYTLSASRVAAHYTAGQARGFPREGNADNVSIRINSVLDVIANQAPRSIRPPQRALLPSFMHGQDAIDEITLARATEAKDSMLFVSKSGFIVFLDADHRSSSPWNTVQATFSDTGSVGTLPYVDIETDYSDALLFNSFNVTRESGNVQTASDATSIQKYGKRSVSITGVLLTSDLFAAQVAADYLAKYKDPQQRINRIDVVAAGNVDLIDNIFRRDLGDKVRVIRTPPGGGSFDQSPWIQRINVKAEPGGADGAMIARISLGVSPT